MGAALRDGRVPRPTPWRGEGVLMAERDRILEGLAAFPYALCSDPESPGALYAGLGDGTIMRSQDAGEGWEEIAHVPSGLQALVAVPA